MKLYRIDNELYFAKNKKHLENWVSKVGGHKIVMNCTTTEVLKMIQAGDSEDYQLVVEGHFSNAGVNDKILDLFEPDKDNINEVEAINYICPIEHQYI
jgi:hypothetical protein